MIDFEAILSCGQEKGGSEVHLTVGRPPMLRRARRLEVLAEFNPVSLTEISSLKNSLLTLEDEEKLEEQGSVEIVYKNCQGKHILCSIFKTLGTFGIIAHLKTLIPSQQGKGGRPENAGDE